MTQQRILYAERDSTARSLPGFTHRQKVERPDYGHGREQTVRQKHDYYIQSALSMDAPCKQEQEQRPLRAVGDFFRKIVISPTYGRPWLDEEGICRMGPLEFLLDENSLES